DSLRGPREPILVGYVESSFRGLGDAREGQVRLLLEVEGAGSHVGPGEVGEVNLLDTKERQLKAELAARLVAQVPCVVPPLGGRVGMGAVVAGESDFASRRRGRRQSEQGDEKQSDDRGIG